jgi:hypothetical protein
MTHSSLLLTAWLSLNGWAKTVRRFLFIRLLLQLNNRTNTLKAASGINRGGFFI